MKVWIDQDLCTGGGGVPGGVHLHGAMSRYEPISHAPKGTQGSNRTPSYTDRRRP